MAETYMLDSGDACLIIGKDCSEIRVVLEQRDVLEETELLAIGLSMLASDPAWRRKLCLKTKARIENGNKSKVDELG